MPLFSTTLRSGIEACRYRGGASNGTILLQNRLVVWRAKFR